MVSHSGSMIQLHGYYLIGLFTVRHRSWIQRCMRPPGFRRSDFSWHGLGLAMEGQCFEGEHHSPREREFAGGHRLVKPSVVSRSFQGLS